MRIEINVAMDYQLCSDETVYLAIEAAETTGQTILSSDLVIEGAELHRITVEGMVGKRGWSFISGERLKLRYRATVDVTRSALDLALLSATDSIPNAVAMYLRPSQFCQSDLFTDFVAAQFGALSGGAKIKAIVAWVTAEIAYISGSSFVGTTAIDTFVGRSGVCRDFAHLVCTLARAAGIPARYASVYGAGVSPPDFHAVAQVWLAGDWHLVDATGMTDASGLVIIAAGRDAGNVAFLETTHWAHPLLQTVSVWPSQQQPKKTSA